MKQGTIFFIIGMTGVFSMLLAPSLNAAPANAINDKFTTGCSGPGSSSSSGPCPGGSENSPQKQQITRNPGGNAPPGQQVPERR
jgi:hypothetical protein